MATKRKRRRKRRRGPTQAPKPAPRPQKPARRGPDDRPSAPWGSFPLTEIAILIALVLLVAGFFVTPPQGFVMIAVGLAIGSLGGLELSIREHLAAYRSHTLLLSAAVGIPIFGGLLVATKLSPAICLASGLVAFGGAAWLFSSVFRRRSGGALYRLRG
jgi:hypothetical protein